MSEEYVTVKIRKDVFEKLREEAELRGFDVPNFINYLFNAYMDFVSRGRCRRKKKISMSEIVSERKVQVLSEINPRNPEAFIKRAEAEGIVVIRGARDTALVDRGFWEEFEKKIPSLPKNIEEISDSKVRKLAEFMINNGLMYYDAIKKMWVKI